MSEMTMTPRFLPSTRSLLFVAVPGAQLLDIVGPMECFDAANKLRAYEGKPTCYTLDVAAPTSTVASASGLRIRTTPLRRARPPHTLVVGGSLGMVRRGAVSKATLAEIGRLAKGAERVVSVCAGSFVLGELGLLDHRRCTTHWLALDTLRRRFPHARVEPDAIFTSDGPIHTSAGVTSGIDLALHLIEQDLDAEMALAVARMLVVFLRRPGGQSQFSASVQLRAGVDQRIRKLVTAIVDAPGRDHRVPVLARRVAMSPRHFARIFTEQTGKTPAAFVTGVRLDAARTALELGDDTVASIADDCGFGSEETLRRAFVKHVGVAPSDYRARFARG